MLSIAELKRSIHETEVAIHLAKSMSEKLRLMEFRAHLKNTLIHTLEIALDDALHSDRPNRRKAA